eukprot:TRINITY_DN12197_c0_g1_i2.p4 TRINITY_DN12197_c0_g1~~TRINITY_DN12197_c0_g1_i2.p4  ORF type:complete len:145 (-),score=11.24 TRINITY_DN12197_c0_g1_i2:2040-2474(-)
MISFSTPCCKNTCVKQGGSAVDVRQMKNVDRIVDLLSRHGNVENPEVFDQAMANKNHTTLKESFELAVAVFERGQVFGRVSWVKIARRDARVLRYIVCNLQPVSTCKCILPNDVAFGLRLCLVQAALQPATTTWPHFDLQTPYS